MWGGGSFLLKLHIAIAMTSPRSGQAPARQRESDAVPHLACTDLSAPRPFCQEWDEHSNPLCQYLPMGSVQCSDIESWRHAPEGERLRSSWPSGNDNREPMEERKQDCFTCPMPASQTKLQMLLKSPERTWWEKLHGDQPAQVCFMYWAKGKAIDKYKKNEHLTMGAIRFL